MEINLELPTCEQEKLDGISYRNAATACEKDVGEQSNSSPTMCEHVKEDLRESNFCCKDQVDLNTNQVDIAKTPFKEPHNGLEFESKEAAYSFYKEYARVVGFGITIKASRRSKRSGKFIDIKIACSRFGIKRESGITVNPRPCAKTDCKACMHMKRKPNDKWIIYSFIKEHNHDICSDDLFRGRNKQTSNVACQMKGMQLALNEGDVQVLIEYFMSMQDENPNFFYAIDLDHDRCLRSVYWVDSKGRLDYQNFHDVVFIDTFYLKTKYKIPFVPIVGVNHHFQYILLGCALIVEESVPAFIWLMQTWLKSVGGLAPKVIITDQEKFLKEAVVKMFPESLHCFCVWHILRKIPENLGYITNLNDFMENFNKCIHSGLDEQFEKEWWKLTDRYELRDNEWVQSLYEDRKRWVPTYMRDVFLAGMSTSVRSESIVSCFDKYICMDASLNEFIERYKLFSTERLDMEAKADFETWRNQPALRSLSPFEKQLSTIYTYAIFRKFQLEILEVASCHLLKEGEDGKNVIFQVDDLERQKKFIVSWNEAELDVNCSCHSFQYKGFLCRHAILVFQMSGITNIPSHYILKRWTKDAKRNQFAIANFNKLTNRMHRFNDLCRRAVKLSELGSLSEDSYHLAFHAMEKVHQHCMNISNSLTSTSELNMSTLNGFVQVEEENHRNHKTKSTKKKSYNKRGRSEPEKINDSILPCLQKREQMTLTAHNFNSCYIPQQDMQTVGRLNTVSTIHEGYYNDQQPLQRLEQLHPWPSRASHFGMRQSMQELLQGQLSFREPTVHGGQLNFREQTVHGCFDHQESLEDIEPDGASHFDGITSKQIDDGSLPHN